MNFIFKKEIEEKLTHKNNATGNNEKNFFEIF